MKQDYNSRLEKLVKDTMTLPWAQGMTEEEVIASCKRTIANRDRTDAAFAKAFGGKGADLSGRDTP